MRFIMIAGILIFLCYIVQAADTGRTYTIALDRDSKVGEKYNIAVSGSDLDTMTVSSNGKILNNETEAFTMRLEGTVQVLEIDDKKRPIKESVTIARCVKIDGEKEVPLATKGTVVTAAVVDDKESYSINGAPVSDDLQKALEIAISLSTSGPSSDEMFGTKAPQHIGNSWDIHADTAAELLSEMEMSAAAKDITGKGVLKEVVTVGGQQCLRIALQMNIARLKLANPPPDMKIKSSACTINVSGLFPVDVLKMQVDEQLDVRTQFVTEGKLDADSPVVTIKITTNSTVATKYSKAESVFVTSEEGG